MKTPLETTMVLSSAGYKKGNLPFGKMLVLSVFAGAFIAFGAMAAIIISSGWPEAVASSGLNKFAMAFVFPVGLMMVVLTGSELFTGNNMVLTIGVLNHQTTMGKLLKNWIVVFIGNFIGAIVVVLLCYLGGFLGEGDVASAVGEKALAVGMTKTGLSFGNAFVRGIGCNILVCLAVWLANCSETVVGKMLSCFFPVMLFVLIGFEHSIANMFFIPASILVPGSTVSIYGFLFNNLLPVTLGNIVGGAVFLAWPLWVVHLKKS